jgi:hypothetical protein
VSYHAPSAARRVFDDMRPLERQLAAARDRATGIPREAHASAARLPFDGLGDVSVWNYPALHVLTASGVYVVRLKCTGLPLADGGALLLFVRAVGLAQNMGFDVRGAAAWQDPGADATTWWIDVICTVTSWKMPSSTTDSAAQIADSVGRDPTLRASFPNLSIDPSASLWGELTGPPQSVDFWKSQPILWDHTLPGPKCAALFGGCGGPTNTFAAPPASSIVKGKADDGAMAIPFAVTAPVPVVTPGASSGSSLATIGVLGALGIAGLFAVGYYYLGQKGHGT